MSNTQVVKYVLKCPCCDEEVATASGCFARERDNGINYKRDMQSSVDALSRELDKRDKKVEDLENEVIKLRNQVAWCLENGALKTTPDYGENKGKAVIKWGSRDIGVPILNKSFTAAIQYAMGSK